MAKTEAEKFQDVESLFGFIMKVQDKIAPQIVSDKEAKAGEHRRGVIIIRGENSWARGFEVVDKRIEVIEDLDNVRTAVVFENVNVFMHVCQELMSGRTSAFSRAKARGDIKIKGNYALRDGLIFNRLLAQIGRILKNYGVDFGVQAGETNG